MRSRILAGGLEGSKGSEVRYFERFPSAFFVGSTISRWHAEIA
jgi:hypothetical protein